MSRWKRHPLISWFSWMTCHCIRRWSPIYAILVKQIWSTNTVALIFLRFLWKFSKSSFQIWVSILNHLKDIGVRDFQFEIFGYIIEEACLLQHTSNKDQKMCSYSDKAQQFEGSMRSKKVDGFKTGDQKVTLRHLHITSIFAANNFPGVWPIIKNFSFTVNLMKCIWIKSNHLLIVNIEVILS